MIKSEIAKAAWMTRVVYVIIAEVSIFMYMAIFEQNLLPN